MTFIKAYLGTTPLFASGWIRPSEWIAMPTITSTEQKVAALFLVGNNNSNFVAFRCYGNYTVNWGDGNVEDVASGVTAKHNYVFSSLSASTEIGPVGSKSRQAMIVITPQAGQNLTSVSFDFKHSSLSSTYTTPILEITLSAPNCTSLLIGSTTGNLRLLEQCTILSHNTTSMSNMFTGCSALQSVPLFITSSVTNMSNMFQSCISLQSVPTLNCSNATAITLFALSCNGLKRCQATSIKGTVSFASCTLGATELNEIYTNLADLTALPTQTITVTNNYGTATDTPAIATAKNWTVVG